MLVDVDVKKAGLYKILYRYANHGRSRVNGDVAVTPDHNVLDGKKQTSSAFFHAQRSNFTYATSEGGDHGVFALNPGRWTVSLRTPEAVFVVGILHSAGWMLLLLYYYYCYYYFFFFKFFCCIFAIIYWYYFGSITEQKDFFELFNKVMI